MAKFVLTIDRNVLQQTLVNRFLVETDHIVGLVEDEFGVKVSVLSRDGKVLTNYVEESFDEIASVIQYGLPLHPDAD